MPVTESRRRPVVTLRAGSRPLRVGRSLYLRGKVRAQLNGGERASVEARTRGRWRHLVTTAIRKNGKYGVKVKLKRAAHSATKRHRLLMRHLRLRLGLHKLRLRAVVRGVGSSSGVVVRIRR
jgi:hypothetical protein